MSHRWLTPLAIAGMTTLLVGPGVAQTTGSGTGAPGSAPGASTPGTTTSPQPAPSPSQPSSPSPSVGTPAGKGMPGTAQPGPAQPGTGQMGSSTTTRSKQSAATNGQARADQVKTLQKALQDKGMDPGPVDGVMGPKTQAALRAYQKDQNLPQTGRTDAQTLEKLGVSR